VHAKTTQQMPIKAAPKTGLRTASRLVLTEGSAGNASPLTHGPLPHEATGVLVLEDDGLDPAALRGQVSSRQPACLHRVPLPRALPDGRSAPAGAPGRTYR